MDGAARTIRRGLDLVYDLAAWLSALCLVAILVVITAQVAARWAGIPFHGSNEYAGYFMAAASFLAFAHTLNRGAHIRVGLLLNALGERRFSSSPPPRRPISPGTPSSWFIGHGSCTMSARART